MEKRTSAGGGLGETALPVQCAAPGRDGSPSRPQASKRSDEYKK
ncbi:MAG: hypothetical protein PHG71_09325 [Kiritimatiellae bacterium]|nr:hypothetical protein [Kiritimatiellia bacterium]